MPAQAAEAPVAQNALSVGAGPSVELEHGTASASQTIGRKPSASSAGARRIVNSDSPIAESIGQGAQPSAQSTGDKPAAAVRHEPASASIPGTHNPSSAILSADTHQLSMRFAASGLGAEAATAARSVAGAGASGLGASTQVGGTGRDIFATLDSPTAVGAPTLIHAAGQRAEAGFEDPSLGWIGVRADMAGNGIHAALVPGSPEAAQVLSAHLTGLSAHLSNEHAAVSSLTMAEPGQGGIASGGFESGSDGGQRNTSQSDGQSSSAARQTAEPPLSEKNLAGLVTESGEPAALPSLDGWRGSRVSVMV